jgi:hypothetical protein
MSSTINLQSTVNWTLPHVRYQPVQIAGDEPALSYANIVVETMLGPPFKWPWNRATATFTTIAGVQDYKQQLLTFGFLESAALVDVNTGRPKELSVKLGLELDAQAERPAYIAQQLADSQGNITFRLSPSPDQEYPVTVTFQQKPWLFTSMASFWYPIPDELGYVFNHGFLSLALLINGDSRFQVFNQRFMAHLLGRQGGLDETERNIFLNNWLGVTSQLQTSQLNTQQRIAARQS